MQITNYMNKINYKQQILDLNQQGKSQKEITEIVGCGHSIVSYYLNPKSQERAVKRQIKKRANKTNYIRIAKGGRCEICGYNKCFRALEFHHINPKEKEFSISDQREADIEKLVTEINKCIMVCANCHREIHSNLISMNDYLDNIYYITKEELENIKHQYSEEKLTIEFPRLQHPKTGFISQNRYCQCGKLKSDSRQDACGECLEINRRKLWPTKEKLEELVWNNLIIDIAKMYNVSEMSVHQWCQAYQINKPPKGFSRKLKEQKIRNLIISKNELAELLSAVPKKNFRQIAKELNISTFQLYRIRRDYNL